MEHLTVLSPEAVTVAFLSVLKSHFARPLHGKQSASRRQAIMSTGKRGFGFRRFKKCWRAQATRAKATVWIRTGNLSITERNALTTEPRLRTGHEII